MINDVPPPSWMTSLVEYLKRGVILDNKEEARRLRSLAPKYTMRGDTLFKRGNSMLLHQCFNDVEAKNVLREVHDGVCGNHAARQSLTLKLLRLGVLLANLEKGLSRVG